MKKLLTIALAALMSVTMLASCAQNPVSTPAAPAAGSKASSTAASTPADKGDPVEIVWMVRAEEPKNYDSVMEKLNEMLLADLNMTLKMRFIAPGDYQQKMEMAYAGGDDWDLCFTAAWATNYVSAAGKGAYLALDDLLEANAPNMMKELPAQFWDGIKVNGQTYAMINYQVMYDQGGQQYRKDVVDAMDIDVKAIKSFDDLTKVLTDVQAKYPDQYATRGGGPNNLQASFLEEHITLLMGSPFLAYDPATKKISNTLYFDKTMPAYNAFREWQVNGLQPADAATLKDENILLKQSMLFNRYQRVKPGSATQLKNNTGLEWYVEPTGEAYIDTAAVQSTLTAVNANSKNPEKAIQMYDYFWGSADAFNMLVYGIEGQDYTLENGKYLRIDGGYSAPAWMLGNQFNVYVNVADDDNIWDETKKGNAEAKLDPLFGFVPNRAPVETELATCEAVMLEYRDILAYGLKEPEPTIQELMTKLEGAGLEKVTAEMQTQLDAWLSSK